MNENHDYDVPEGRCRCEPGEVFTDGPGTCPRCHGWTNEQWAKNCIAGGFTEVKTSRNRMVEGADDGEEWWYHGRR